MTTATATMETVLTTEQQMLLDRFYHACDAARRFSRDEYHLAVNVTRLWNWIDADGLPMEHGMAEVLWECLAAEFPECFQNPDSPNSINCASWKPITITATPARYSAGVVLQSPFSGTGFKSDAHYLIEASGARYVHRSRGYVASQSHADVLQWAESMGFKAHMVWSHRTAAEQQVYYLPWLGDHSELRFCFRQLKTLHSLALKRVPMCSDLLKIVSAELVRDAATGRLKVRPDIRGLRKRFEPKTIRKAKQKPCEEPPTQLPRDLKGSPQITVRMACADGSTTDWIVIPGADGTTFRIVLDDEFRTILPEETLAEAVVRDRTEWTCRIWADFPSKWITGLISVNPN